MGNCTASKLTSFNSSNADADDPVALCRHRKRLLKLAVHRRYALAAAHANYLHSLNSLAAALDLFVARHCAPTPLLTMLPQPPSPSKPKPPPLPVPPSPSLSTTSSDDDHDDHHSLPENKEGAEEEDGERGYLFDDNVATEGFGWDFFNPFDGVWGASDEELRAVREVEGIPDLEEAEEEVVVVENGVKVAPLATEEKMEKSKECEEDLVKYEESVEVVEEKGLAVTEIGGSKKELLQALRDVEDQFIRAYDSGKEVSRMLESTRFQLQSGLDEIKENSSKIIHAITWHRTPSSLSSSSRSQLASSSVSTSWTESNSEIFNDYGGMASGSHSQTLGRLYAWEKKLYEEVKAGDRTQQLYEKKCMQLRNLDAKGSDSRTVDKARTAVRDLYTRIWVALRAAESISQQIQKLRDEELQPQIIELMQGLMESWKIMLESHETQKQIIFEVNVFTCPAYGKYCNESQCLATNVLAAELRNWRTCFMSYVSAQKAYVEALDGWLSKFVIPDLEYYTGARTSLSSSKAGAPPLVVICHEWYTSLTKMPDKPVAIGMRNFTRIVRSLWVKQGEEMHQKRKVDMLAKDLDRRILAFQKSENKVLESKLTENKSETDIRQKVENLTGRKELLDILRRKLDAEKAKHHDCMQETHEITLNGFKIGLASIFESLTEFSKDSVKLYSELLTHSEKAMLTNGLKYKSCFIEGSAPAMDSDNR